MSEDADAKNKNSETSGINVGDVTDGIHDSSIAGRDVNHSSTSKSVQTAGGDAVSGDQTVGRDKITVQNQQIFIVQSDARLDHSNKLSLSRIAETPFLPHPISSAHIFISYKRNVDPDEPLALRLRSVLEEAGHNVFIDQKISVGLDWAAEIHRQIEISDFLLVLLSEVSIHSEMVAEEILHAHQHFERTGKARLIPVRVNYDGPLPYRISHILDKLQYATWSDAEDDLCLSRQILDALKALASLNAPAASAVPSVLRVATAQPHADPRFLESLREPGGAVRADSEFYISRAEDQLLRTELSKRHGTTTTIRAARQTGKSSLLVNSMSHTKEQGSRVVYIDLQPVETSALESLDAFLRYFVTILVRKLRLDTAEVDAAWGSSLGAPDKTTYLLEDYLLPTIKGPIVLALDEVDRLLLTPFHDTFFGLLRSWHNNRAWDDLWDRLDIVMVISTEPHLLIGDVTQSPFNVGQKLRLQDFNEDQVRELNQRYRSPLDDPALTDLIDYLQGHPYLTHKAIYTLVTEQSSWPRLRESLIAERSPVGDHLRRYLWLLRDQPQLRAALKGIIRFGECPDEESYYRLLQAGLVQGVTRAACTCRCKLYTEYLDDKL